MEFWPQWLNGGKVQQFDSGKTADDQPNEQAVSSTAPMSLSILGATGSVGTSTLGVVNAAKPGTFQIKALTANENVDQLAHISRQHGAEIAAIANPARYQDLKSALFGSGVAVAAGPAGLEEAADRDVDCVMAAIVGAAGLRPALTAARRARRLAIANKECLVISGALFMAELAAAGTEILPVDSEHAAVFQVLTGCDLKSVDRIILTASGGPFRTWSMEQLKNASRKDALNHPNWSMGNKITIDSATLMNKGLELIEAYHLFGLTPAHYDAVIHPQSKIHCLVEFCDGSMVAQLAEPDMSIPITQSLYWPDRPPVREHRLDFREALELHFEPIDPARFPAFGLARAALQAGGAAPAVLNGANEAAVSAFLDGDIRFLDIATTVAETMDKALKLDLFAPFADVDAALEIDCEARKLARDVMARLR